MCLCADLYTINEQKSCVKYKITETLFGNKDV
jgi:hypothetical protein